MTNVSLLFRRRWLRNDAKSPWFAEAFEVRRSKLACFTGKQRHEPNADQIIAYNTLVAS